MTVVIVLLVVLGVIGVGIVACVGVGAALFMPVVSRAREAAEEAMHKNNLRQLGIAYIVQQETTATGAGPSSWSDIRRQGNLDEEVIGQLLAQQVEVVWEIRRDDFDRSKLSLSDVVIAYPAALMGNAADNLPVLMADGSVQELSSAELASKLQAWEDEQPASRKDQAEFEE